MHGGLVTNPAGPQMLEEPGRLAATVGFYLCSLVCHLKVLVIVSMQTQDPFFSKVSGVERFFPGLDPTSDS